jgi:hypothetical protein
LSGRQEASPRFAWETAADGVIDGYVDWREACAHIEVAYERWCRSERSDRHLAFAVYVAALDQEEHAARVYEQSIDRVRRLSRRAAEPWPKAA